MPILAGGNCVKFLSKTCCKVLQKGLKSIILLIYDFYEVILCLGKSATVVLNVTEPLNKCGIFEKIYGVKEDNNGHQRRIT